MSSPRYLLVGAASELSLRPLADELRRRALPVSLVDLAEEPATPSTAPAGDGPLVLVTSQHLAMTGQVYDAYSAITTHVASPQALKVALGADLLVYVPHDLADPVLPAEIPLLPLLDLFVAPDESSWWAGAHVPTVVGGWVGSLGADQFTPPPQVRDRGILFVSAVNWLMSRGGGPFLVESLRRTLEHGLAVKLPVWPGVAELEDSLEAEGIVMVDAHVSASALIASAPLVVTTAAGSIIAEASLAGHRPLCVLPPGADDQFGSELATFDVVTCRDEEFPEAVSLAGRPRAGAAPFDTDVFLAAVRERLEAGLHV
jgi:hypothetical protein